MPLQLPLVPQHGAPTCVSVPASITAPWVDPGVVLSYVRECIFSDAVFNRLHVGK